VRMTLARASVLMTLTVTTTALLPAAAEASLGDRAPLRAGMRGQDIRVLQDYLTKAGYETDVDGAFGRATRTSVRLFERARGEQPDGIVTADEIVALRQAVEGTGTPAAPRAAGTTTPTEEATIGPDGKAVAPASAPPQVQQIIAAANEIEGMPYKYGGGHGKWNDTGYDCSGSVSYALHGAGLLDDAMPSGSFETWGEPGEGTWVTIYANGGHMYMVVAGLRFDTSARRQVGGRWTTASRPASGYTVRHPEGL
jgi:peptidoglycan hydrolase-like protein with peptidoglycan-binding domain